MMLVLDTHIWLWWMTEHERLKPEWREKIESADRVGVSAISLFEVAWLEHRGRISLGCALDWWFEQALQASGIELLPITPDVAITAVSFPEHHSDPQDRLIMATALEHQAALFQQMESSSFIRRWKACSFPERFDAVDVVAGVGAFDGGMGGGAGQ